MAPERIARDVGGSNACDLSGRDMDAEAEATAERERRTEIFAAWVRSGGRLENPAAVLLAVQRGEFDPAAWPDDRQICRRCRRAHTSQSRDDGLCSNCRGTIKSKGRRCGVCKIRMARCAGGMCDRCAADPEWIRRVKGMLARGGSREGSTGASVSPDGADGGDRGQL